MPTKTARCSSITLPCKCGLGPERLSGCGTAVVETAPSSVSGFRALGGRGLAPTLSLAGLVSAGNSDIQGGGSRRPTRRASNGAFDSLLGPRDPPLPAPTRGAGALTPSILPKCSRL